jgi:hypothetical protein
MGSRPVKKGRHRRFEEARALKRSTDIDFDSLLESLQKDAGPARSGPADDEDAVSDDLDEDEDDDAR